jgi:hypothetical protein
MIGFGLEDSSNWRFSVYVSRLQEQEAEVAQIQEMWW